MKKILTVITVSLLLLSCGSGKQTPNDSVVKWNSGDIKGKVKSIIATTTYIVSTNEEENQISQEADVSLEIYNTKGLLSESRWYNSDSLLTQRMLFTYDEDNRLIRNDYFDYSAISSESDSSYFILSYDTDGRVVKEEVYYNNKLNSFSEKSYNSNGDITLYQSYRQGSKVAESRYEYVYNNEDRKTEEKQLSNETLISTMHWKYDSAGRTTSVETMDGKYILSETYRYDSKNRLVEEVLAPSGPSMKRITTYKYDGNDNMVELAQKTEEGNILKSCTYTYDKQGNWIRSADKTGSSQVVCERKIEYYEQ